MNTPIYPKSLRTLFRVLTIAAVLTLLTPILTTPVAVQAVVTQRLVPQISIPPIESFPSQPAPYAYMDWKQRTLDYDSWAFDWAKSSECPTIRWDTTHYNVSFNVIAMPTYYCDPRLNTDGKQESFAVQNSVLSGALVGVNKSNQGGNDYVNMMQTFIHNSPSYPNRKLVYNQPNPSSGVHGDWWYDSAPSVYFYALAEKYPGETWTTAKMQAIADRLNTMVTNLGGANPNFMHKAYNHDTDTPVDGGWNVPEAGITTALTEYWAYKKFGTASYLTTANNSMNYFVKTGGNPYYEVGIVFGPYIAARLNAEQGTNYDVGKFLFWMLTTNSPVRSGWGTIQANWNGYDVYGVQGSSTDGGGYGFMMNTFATAYLAPTVKYDHRYAKAIGKFLLNVSNAARFFYPDQMPANKQYHGSTYINAPEKVVPYEGFRISEDGQSPRATGDPHKFCVNWGCQGAKDLSFYSGSHVGLFGAIFKSTNVSKILQIDVNALDSYKGTSYPTYLYYNPYTTAQSVQITLGGASDLFDVLRGDYIAQNVSGTQSFSIPPDYAVLLVVAPPNSTLTYSGTQTLINGVVVAYQPPSGSNLAWGRPATASSSVGSNTTAKGVDWDGSTRWESASSDPQWIYVDLGATYSVNRVVLRWEAAYGKTYKIQVSPNASTWTDVYSTSTGDGGLDTITFTATNARYVRMYGTQRGTGYGYSLFEFEVYPAANNVAWGRPETVSSTESSSLAGKYGVDGKGVSRWASAASDPQWIYVDLGATYSVNRVVLRWEAAYGKSYKIQVSPNASTWTDVYSTTSGDGGLDNITFTATNARYVRMYGTQRGTGYGYSLFEFEVYGN